MSEQSAGFFSKLKKKLVSFVISIGLVAVCFGMLWRHYRTNGNNGDDLISQMENTLLDLRFRFRGPMKPSGKMGILAIDEKSLQKFGRWPIARKDYEKTFDNLKALGAEWVGFDVVWAEAERPLLEDVKQEIEALKTTDDPGTAKASLAQIDKVMEASLGDQSVARMIKNYEKIVLGFFYYASKEEGRALGDTPFRGKASMEASAIQGLILPDGKELKDYEPLKAYGIVANTDFIASHAENFAFFNNESDSDAIMRWVTLVRNIDGNLMPSLSLKLAARITGREPVVFFDQYGVTEVSLMNPNDDQDLLKIPVDHTGYGRILINHYGPDKTIPHYSLADVYDMKLTEEQKRDLKGRSLILGPTAIAINDQRANPFDAGINGVENHAAAVENIVGNTFMRRTENIYVTELLIVLLIGLFFAPIMVVAKAAWSGVAAVLILAGYYYFDKYFWFGKGEWVYMGMPFIEITSLYIGNTLYKYMVEERERRKTKGVLSLYLSPDVTEQVLDSEGDLKLGGEKKELTVFFSDVRGFTTISEHLTPEKLCELMNDYFTPMADIIQTSKGVLDKYIGDAIMAFWGAPAKIEDHASVGCRAAVSMLFALDKVRADLQKKGFPVIDIGIGLNTGNMSVGNMGSPQRFTYTVMGDSVNLGARLEGLTKEYGIKIMISEFTKAKVKGNDILTRDLDDIKVKGKNEPVRVYEVLRPDTLKSEAALKNLIGEFELGRECYRKQDWPKAEKHFLNCLTLRPDDGPAAFYLKDMEEEQYKAKPFDEGWDGVRVFKHK